MNEEVKVITKREKIKQHLQENKKAYLTSAGSLAVGFLLRPQVVNIVDVFNFKYNSPTHNTVITVLERRSCKEPLPVRCLETGEVFASMRRAAVMLDVPRQKIADQIRGKIPNVNNLHFEEIA